jgi:hypothetical protein
VKHLATLVLAALALATVFATSASAQERSAGYAMHSPEYVAAELRLGPYRPPLDPALRKETGNDRGPFVGGEVDIWATRLPYVGLLGGGLGVGWTKYKGFACGDPACTTTSSQSMSLKLFPLYAVAVLRIDALARYVGVPLVFSAKAGVEYVRIRLDDPSNSTCTHCGAIGFRWGAQLALELDVFNRTAANRLDAEWGINHSYIFFELYGSTSKNNDFDVSESVAWVGGLGLVF